MDKQWLKIVVLIGLSVGCAVPASAQTRHPAGEHAANREQPVAASGMTVTLDQLIQEAMENNPLIEASQNNIAAEIDPNCIAGNCRLWLANAGGGVWRTGNALAAGPAWQFVCQTFEHNNVAALALDRKDSSSNTLWAGTGEPNACGSGLATSSRPIACARARVAARRVSRPQ